MAKENHSGRNLAVGALLAGFTGYVAGILTAPKSGKETRADIANKAGDVKAELLTQLQNVHDELDDLLNEAKVKTLSLSSKARAEFNESVTKAKDAKSKAASTIKAAKAGKAEDPDLNKAVKQARAAAKNLAKYFKS